MERVVLVAVSTELAEQMLEDDGLPLRRDTRVRLKPADDWEREMTGATYSMIFTEERDPR